nr:hypothetical protein BaRGS_011421 [Batillaria attramentaria]
MWAWFNAARAMECLALICFLLAVAVEIYQDVYKIPPPADNKALEALALAADSLPSLAPFRIPLGSKLVKDDIVRDLVFESTETI